MRAGRDVTNSSTSCKTPSQDKSGYGGLLGGKAKTPSSKTPGKTPGKTPTNRLKKLTPSRNGTSVTPGGGDRYIPNRSASHFDIGNFLMTSQSQNESQSSSGSSNVMTPGKLEYQRLMSENLNGGVTSLSDLHNSDPNATCNMNIFAYQKKAPLAPQGYTNAQRVIYSSRATPASSCKKSSRHIPAQPERILDAPEISDDYYLNLLDWNRMNILAVALAGHVYLWNAATGDIQQLLELEGTQDYISSVNWINEGNYLAVGTSTGDVQLWDATNNRRLRCMAGHTARVGSLSWNGHVLSSGCRSGAIRHHDVRVSEHLIGTLNGHTQEVCGLKWSPDGRFLASGGNDNLLQVWPQVASQFYSESTPLYTLTDHQAAVKALSWCPWQPSILASGGGTADRHIRFWNVNTGQCINAVDTESQVCSILWNSEYKEIISGHGFPSHQLAIWKYPKMTKVTELVGHTARVLHLSMSPDSQMVVSAAADESLRIWNCFAQDPDKKKSLHSGNGRTGALQNKVMAGTIRAVIR